MTLLTLTLNGLIMNFIKNFIAEEDGVTAIEYGLIAALIAAVIVVSVTSIGKNIADVFTKIAAKITAA
jgi:pilus assembly protein Flp/PilA